MINWMKENLSCSDISIIPTKCEESSIPLADNIADLVYLMNLHHELEAPENMLLESHRLLKKGGKIALIDWKPEETPEGPPVSIRIPEDTVFNQLKNTAFLISKIIIFYLITTF
jgi:SAM-dependent methyltransferase